MPHSPATSAVHAPIPHRPLRASAAGHTVPSFSSNNERHRTMTRCASPRDLPTRLLSPIRLAERRALPACSRAASPTPSCSSKRRRVNHTRASNRPRRCAPTDSFLDMSSGSHIFDELPWISLLNSPSNQLNPWDIADISLLNVEKRDHTEMGAGPIRRRKTSLRSNPFPTDGSLTTPELSPSLSIDSLPSIDIPFSLPQRPSVGADEVPKTPPRRTSHPMAIKFHDLMPVSFSHADVEGPWWRNDLNSP